MKASIPSSQTKLLAAAIIEIRTLLSTHLGSESNADSGVRLAAHLSYALHNEARSILEGEATFDLNIALSKINSAEQVVGTKLTDQFGTLTKSVSDPL